MVLVRIWNKNELILLIWGVNFTYLMLLFFLFFFSFCNLINTVQLLLSLVIWLTFRFFGPLICHYFQKFTCVNNFFYKNTSIYLEGLSFSLPQFKKTHAWKGREWIPLGRRKFPRVDKEEASTKETTVREKYTVYKEQKHSKHLVHTKNISKSDTYTVATKRHEAPSPCSKQITSRQSPIR